jgi:hypothetical protein
MGYRSEFKVSVDPRPEEFTEVFDEITGYNARFLQDVKWYEITSDLEDLSNHFPDTKISVHQIGEDGDQTIYDALNGVVDERRGEITFPRRTLWESL